MNEELAALGPYAQLLFEGLWCLADRDGKLEDRPARIKAEIFPYYDPEPDVITLLEKLCECNFIQRYSVDHIKCIMVNKFREHQNPHPHEAESKLPNPNNINVMESREMSLQVTKCTADILNPDIMNPSTCNDMAGKVFEYWKSVMGHGRAILDGNRKRKIELRLKEGRTFEECKKAIDGCKSSPYHQGANDRKRVYDDIELIFRDAKHFEQFLNIIPSEDPYKDFPRIGGPGGQKT